MSKKRRKRSKATKVILFPVLIVIYAIGWCLFWAGDRKATSKKKHKNPTKQNLTLLPIILEEDQKIPI